MISKTIEKELALKLRHRGLSISDISKKLALSKSTVSYWCRDITLSPAQLKRLVSQHREASMKSVLRLAELKREKRLQETIKETERGKRDVGALTKRDLFILGLALYWGEGYKKGNEEFGFTNSDSFIIKNIIKWLEEIYSVSREQLILRVSVNEIHRNREFKILRYWQKITYVPLSQFTKTSFIKARVQKNYSNHRQHFGTLRIKVRRGTNLRRRVLGSIAALGGSK